MEDLERCRKSICCNFPLEKIKGLNPLIKLVFNPFLPIFPFDPPENITKPKVFLYFQGYQKGALGRKGLIQLLKLGFFLPGHFHSEKGVFRF